MRRRVVPFAIAVALVPLASCDRGVVPSGKAFCDRVTARLAELRGNVTDVETAKRAVQAYRDVGVVAPAPVRDAWRTVTALVESASTLDLTSKDAQARFAEQALAADAQIERVTEYTRTTCGVELTP